MDILIDLIIPTILSIIISVLVLPRTQLNRFHNRFRFGAQQKNGQVTARASRIGALAFFPIFMIAVGVNCLIAMRFDNTETTLPLSDQVAKILQLMTGMSILYIVGGIDDISGTSVKNKITALFAACALLPVSGLWLNNLYGLFGLYVIPSWIGIPLTILLAMYFTATITLTDSIEGMATGQCTIALLIILGLGAYAGARLSIFMSCAALGFTITFFVTNFFRRKKKDVFMGYSGSMPLGYLICFVIMCIYKNKEWVGTGDGLVLAATCTMLLPGFDMMRVLKSRMVDRRDILRPDRNYLFHKLMRIGLDRFSILAVYLGTNLLFVFASGLLMNKQMNITYILLVDILMFILLHLIINMVIDRQAKAINGQEWEKTYGKENWSEETQNQELESLGLQGAAEYILNDVETQKAKIISDATPKMDSIPFIPDGMNALERNIKRIIDCIVAAVLMVVFSPLFLFCYIRIKMDDGGPAIFKQERIGRFGRPFYIYKFRSMRLDAETNGPQLSHASGEEDERLTKAGRFLRAHHLDELPQLLNVFSGQMAFIGYRPERMFYIQQIVENDPRYYMLYQIRPGVTSYATLYNGYTDTMEKMLTRLELDLYYLKHRSWWFDAKILFLTFWHIIGGKKF